MSYEEVQTWDSKTPHVGFNAFFLTVEILLFASPLGGTFKSMLLITRARPTEMAQKASFRPVVSCMNTLKVTLSLSLSLSHTHTHTRTHTCAGVVFAWHVEALDELDVEEAGRSPLARHLIQTIRVGLVKS